MYLRSAKPHKNKGANMAGNKHTDNSSEALQPHSQRSRFRLLDRWFTKRQQQNEHNPLIHKQKADSRFTHLLKTANDIATINPNGLIDLVRAILRPLQSDYLLGIAERGQDALPPIVSYTFFGNDVRDRLFSSDGINWRGSKLEAPYYTLQLSRDIVLPCAWSYAGYVNALATIGSNKQPETTDRSYQGGWRQDQNHRVDVWLPWGIGFVNGGNHSITAGILAGEGEIKPDTIYDMAFLLDDLQCDGVNFIDTQSGTNLGPVLDWRTAAVFEIGRLIRSHLIVTIK